MEHQGKIFVDRFDANSYLYITKAVDYFDLGKKYGSLEDAFKRTNAKFLIMSFTSDWLFPTSQSKEMVNALLRTGKDVSFCEIESPCGHDAFLLEFETQTNIVKVLNSIGVPCSRKTIGRNIDYLIDFGYRCHFPLCIQIEFY